MENIAGEQGLALQQIFPYKSSHTPLGATVKLTVSNWLFYFSNQYITLYLSRQNTVISNNSYKLIETLCWQSFSNKKYLTNKVYVVNSNEELGENWGIKIFVRNGGQQKSNCQTTLSTWLKKQTLGLRPQRCVRNIFHYFVPRPVENTTYSFQTVINLVPRDSFPLTSGRKTRALGASISGMRHRIIKSHSLMTGGLKLRHFDIFDMLFPFLAFVNL